MNSCLRSLVGIGFTLFLSRHLLAQEPAPAVTSLPPTVVRTVEQLRAAGLADNNGYAIVEDLVTRVGPRLGGSPEEARAREWAVAMLREQGFASIRIEPFPMPMWQPTSESAVIVSPHAQALAIAAIGGSPSTPPGGVEAEIVRFASVAALLDAPQEVTTGRIVYIDEPMVRTADGSGYGAAVAKRRGCGPAAKRKDAVACLIRSAGTNTDRFAHQGMGTAGTHLTLAPSAALAPPDADTLTQLLARATTPVRVRLVIQATTTPNAPSGNVLAEVRGRESPDEIVLAAAHLDSWTMGQGAVDDGAGIAIITAAAKLINDLPQKPRRTIRILLAGSEEQGDFGGIAYGAAHSKDKHVAAAESDSGAGPIWRLRTRFGEGALPHARALQRALGPLAVIAGDNGLAPGSGGSDIGAITQQGTPIIALNQDASKYFDVHHTANDTLAQINRTELRQNIAAWAITLYLAAEMGWDFRAGTATP
jgi:Zn-dependent M28 family amino/carboxypeptidase